VSGVIDFSEYRSCVTFQTAAALSVISGKIRRRYNR